MSPKVVFCASGGGTGFDNCCAGLEDGRLDANIVGLIHNVPCGAVDIAKKRGIRTRYFPKSERVPGAHEALVRELSGDDECFGMASGALWKLEMKDGPDDPGPGLDPRYWVNIHPGLLSLRYPDRQPVLGGHRMHGDIVHDTAVHLGLRDSGLAMHFMTKEFDDGPIIFEYPVPIIYREGRHLKRGVNAMEHYFQPWVTDLVVHKQIQWDGKNGWSLVVPKGYRFLPSS